jgi:hypothetical protein
MRYVWASVVAVAIISFGVHFVRHTHEGVERMIQKAAADSSQPMPALAPSNNANIGIEMPSSRIFQVAVADFLFKFWYVFVLLVLLACFGTAALAGRGSKSSPSNSQTSES